MCDDKHSGPGLCTTDISIYYRVSRVDYGVHCCPNREESSQCRQGLDSILALSYNAGTLNSKPAEVYMLIFYIH